MNLSMENVLMICYFKKWVEFELLTRICVNNRDDELNPFSNSKDK